MSEEQEKTVESPPSFFELGDVIKIIAPSNSDINEKTYLIQYLDENEIDILDIDTLNKSTLSTTDGNLDDQSIESIEIISKPTLEGFARQNNLLPGTWITLQLGGDVPTTINGEITSLEEDMIEINTWPSNKKIYIDFEYKGIPKNLPIDSIRPFAPPPADPKELPKTPSPEFPELSPLIDFREGEEDLGTPLDVDEVVTRNILAQRKEILLDADDIIFGEKLGAITQEVAVSESERRFGIETQSDDLLNDLLSTIPTSARSTRVLKSIHIMVERYQQLRQEFSKLSQDGEYDIPDTKTAEYKPLVKNLQDLNAKLYWLLPIAKNRKNIYDMKIDDEDDTSDIVNTTLGDAQTDIYEIVSQYMTNTVPDGENKYEYLCGALNRYLTPFTDPNLKNNILISSRVNETMNVIIGNFENIISSVVCGEKFQQEKLIMGRYEKALTRPNIRDLKKRRMSPDLVDLTPGDKLSLLGYLQLPEAFVRYSQINLPQTNILLKSTLNQIPFSYFEYLNNNNPSDININSIEQDASPSKTDKEDFLKKFEMYVFEQTTNLEDRDKGHYTNFLNNMVPRTRSLFNMMKKYYKNATSFLNILFHLQPFMVYADDITFKQYEEIVNFMRNNILKFKKQLVQNNTSYINYTSRKYKNPSNYDNFNTGFKNSYLFNLLDSKKSLASQTEIAYKLSGIDAEEGGLETSMRENISTPEFIKRIYTSDYGSLFANTVSLEDIDLFVGMDVDAVIKTKLEYLNGERKEEESRDGVECNNFILAKYYLDIDDLKNDDGKSDVYFDTKYDETRYDIIDEFESQQSTMSSTDFNAFLLNHLIGNVGLTDIAAIREAKAMIEKKRLVYEGDYCYLTTEQGINIYYIRDNNNTWIHKSEYDGNDINATMFCNLKKSCMTINKECNNMIINKTKLEQQLLNEMLEQFDQNLQLDQGAIKTKLNEQRVYLIQRINMLREIDNLLTVRYDEVKFAIGQTMPERQLIASPYSELRDLILSHPDFVKRQTDILKFISKTCQPLSWSPEGGDDNWLYCIKTGKKLLPTFYERLAKAFFSGNYQQVLERVVAERGEISDDGDKIVDKFSGYTIRMIEFDDAEGFSESGYKIVSRALIDKDIGDVLMDMSFKPTDKLKSKDGEMISNVINTLQQQMGISIGSSKEFIIKNVESTLDTYLPSAELYKQKAKQAKSRKINLGSYIDMHDEALLLLTLGYFMIATQTAMPSVITSKTFKGCGPKSFEGYPLEGPGDYSALKYISCCALRLRSRTRPWQRLPRLTRDKAVITLKSFMEKLKKLIDKEILKNRNVTEKIDSKLLYLQNESPGEAIPMEFDVKRWLTFLPPLFPVNVKEIQPLPANFQENLERDIESANPRQFDRISMLYGKMTLMSMHILELIQRVINKESLLLSNSQNELLVENACCNNGSKITRVYFEEKENSIRTVNNNVQKYGQIYNMVEDLIMPFYLFDPLNTKLKYPAVPKTFSENTIYRAFIRFCYYNTGFILSEQLERVCGTNASAFKSTNDISEKIEILKREGKNYSIDDFLRLMNIVNKSNIVQVDMNEDIISPRVSFENLMKNDEILSDIQGTDLETFMSMMTNILDRYDVLLGQTNKDEDVINTFTAFLQDRTNELMSEIIEYTDIEDDANTLEFFNTIGNWKLRGENIYMSLEDETAETFYNYANTYIKNILQIYPTIIADGGKKTDYKTPSVPVHWTTGAQKLSNTHIKDVKNIISKEFSRLYEFYGDVEIKPMLEDISNSATTNTIIVISKLLPFFADIRLESGQPRVKTILNGDTIKRVMKFLIMRSLYEYIKIAEVYSENESVVQTGNISGEGLEEDILRGRALLLRQKTSNIIKAFIAILKNQKSVINISNEEINLNVNKSKEKEKSKITKNLGDLTVEERKVQDIMKNHKIGDWSLGQTRALFVYDEDQYEKERHELEVDALNEMQIDAMDGVTERTREIYQLDWANEQLEDQQMQNEIGNAILQQGDDDDGPEDFF
jgi:hypothetical protein